MQTWIREQAGEGRVQEQDGETDVELCHIHMPVMTFTAGGSERAGEFLTVPVPATTFDSTSPGLEEVKQPRTKVRCTRKVPGRMREMQAGKTQGGIDESRRVIQRFVSTKKHDLLSWSAGEDVPGEGSRETSQL